MSRRPRILLFAEDPGAANCAAPLVAPLRVKGCRVDLRACGLARAVFDRLDLRAGTLEPGAEEALLDASRPDLVLTGTAENPDTPGLVLIAGCRRRGIVSAAIVDAPMNSDRRFRGRARDPLARIPDWIFVADEPTRQSYVALGVDAAQVVVCGHPHYDAVRRTAAAWRRRRRTAARRRLAPGAGEGQPIIVFAAENEGPPALCRRSAGYTLRGFGPSPWRGDIVLSEFVRAALSLRPRPYLVLRLHPKNTDADFATLRPAFNGISRGGSPLELVWAADAVVGMTSMLLLEAALLGRPTVAIVPRAEELAWLPTVAAGLTEGVSRRREIGPAIRRALARKAIPPQAIRDFAPQGATGRVVCAACALGRSAGRLAGGRETTHGV